MNNSEWAKRTVLALHALGKRKHGGLSRAEEEAKVGQSYLRQRKHAGTIDLRKMFALLEAFGEHPARFFKQVFPAHELGYRTYVDVPESPAPEIIATAYRRLASTEEGSIARSHLEALDALRFEKPLTTLDSATVALSFVAHVDVPFALGVWASAQRQLAYFEDATHALVAGLTIAKERGDLSAEGNLLRRLSYIIADAGQYGDAVAVATLATDALAQAGNRPAIGKSMVDRSAWMFYLDRFEDVVAMVDRAIPLLAEDDSLYQVTARQYLSISHNALGDPTKASRYIREAWSFAGNLSTTTKSKLAWLEALIDAGQGAFELSEQRLCRVVSTLAGIHCGEAALATVDLAEVQLRAGKPKSAFESTQRILPFITPLGVRHIVVRSAELVLVDLARHGTRGMSDQVLTDLRTLLGKAKREHREWRSLKTNS